MLPRELRLPGYCIPRVLSGKTIWRGQGLLIKVSPNELKGYRAAVTVSSRFLTKAVARNRLKRRLTAVLEQAVIDSGFDILVMAGRYD